MASQGAARKSLLLHERREELRKLEVAGQGVVLRWRKLAWWRNVLAVVMIRTVGVLRIPLGDGA